MMSSVTGGCPLALVILLLVSMDPTATDVVTSVTKCAQFFMNRTPPTIPGVLEKGIIQDQNHYKPICQKYKNAMRFMTLYDTVNKIPVFSAYKYTGHTGKRPKTPSWRTEPQLGHNEQASDGDYKNIPPYNRGHLFPGLHANQAADIESTFTLTNIVPQDESFNGGSWCQMEQHVKEVMDELCCDNSIKHLAFVVTGAVPSVSSHLNPVNKVNIPDTLWTAFCCYSKIDGGKWLAGAHWGNNVPEYKGPKMVTKTLADLNNTLNVEPFKDANCIGHSQVSQYYPRPKKGDTCPLPKPNPNPIKCNPTQNIIG